MINNCKKYLLFVFLFSMSFSSAQPVVDLFNVQEVTLDNGIVVTLYGKAYSVDESKQRYPPRYRAPQMNTARLSSMLDSYAKTKKYSSLILRSGDPIQAKDNEYYYLPCNLRLAKRPEDGVPEFLFLKYVTEEREDQGGISGALMHFLMEWGLPEDLRAQCEANLGQRVPGAKVIGPVMLFQPEGESFSIISATVGKDNKDFTRSVVTSGQAPLLPGQKIAAATNLTKYGAQLLAATFEKSNKTNQQSTSITDLSVNLKYRFQARVPACRGKIIIDWSKVASALSTRFSDQKFTYNKYVHVIDEHWYGDDQEVVDASSISKTSGSYDSQSSVSRKAITIIFEESYSDERVSAIRDAFFKVMEDMIAKALDIDEEPLVSVDEKDMDQAQKDNEADLSSKVKNYDYFSYKIKELSKKGRQTLNLNIGLMVNRDYFLTENLASWYNSVKDNKSCISSINLNDPFYKHLDIRFILDLEAKEMFDKEVNYVTVNVRKKRNEGNPFMDRLTFDADYVKNKGITRSMTYAAGEDKNPDIYEYQTQWSLRGGNIFPPTPFWQKGQLEAVTLKPPVTPRTIEFEANLDDLKASDLSRATLQIRYMKFGVETEENIAISPAKNEALISKMLFTDRNTQGYAYRIIYNHTLEGKLATDWVSKVNDNYVYATIPEKFRDKTSEIFQKAKDAAKAIVPAAADGTVTTDKILDGFKEIFGVVKGVLNK